MYCNQREFVISLEIHRDGLYSPWGFRLKGGIDVDGGTPLEIVKVRLKQLCSYARRIVHTPILYLHASGITNLQLVFEGTHFHVLQGVPLLT